MPVLGFIAGCIMVFVMAQGIWERWHSELMFLFWTGVFCVIGTVAAVVLHHYWTEVKPIQDRELKRQVAKQEQEQLEQEYLANLRVLPQYPSPNDFQGELQKRLR